MAGLLSDDLKAFFAGAKAGRLDAIEAGIERGWANKAGPNGESAIYCAIRAGSAEGVAALARACDKEAVDEKGFTPLIMAATYGSAAMVKMLIEGSDASAKNKVGHTALMAALHVGRLDNVQELLPTAREDHADKKSRGEPLMIAAIWMPIQAEALRALSEEAAVKREKMFESTVIQIMSAMLSTSCEDQEIVEEIAAMLEANEHGRSVVAPAMRGHMRSMIEREAIVGAVSTGHPNGERGANRLRI